MKKDPEIKNKAFSPIAKAVKNFKKRNAPFIRIEKSDPDTENVTPKQSTQVVTGNRGIVYLGHLPKGFYEDEMRQYFSQFGNVTRIKLARSKKTGVSKGYAFIEFRFSEVAKIVAETMNNYLLFDRLLKANYVDKTYPASFWYRAPTAETYPGVRSRRNNARLKNSFIAPEKEMKRSQQNLRRLNAKLRKLKEKGINYDVQTDDLVAVDKKIDLNNVPVLEVDESDDEIEFKVPAYFIKKSITKKDSPKNKHLRKKRKNMRPLMSTPLGDKGNPLITSAETLEQIPDHSAQKSGKRKSPVKVESAVNVKTEQTPISQRNGKSPIRKKAKPSEDSKSSMILSPVETGRQIQGLPTEKSVKRKSSVKSEPVLNVKSEQEDVSQRNAKSPQKIKAESNKDNLQDTKLPPMSSPVGVKRNTQISPKQKQDFSAKKSGKGKSPLRAQSAVNVKSEPNQINQRNGKSPLRKEAESSTTKNLVQKGKQQREPKTQILNKNSNDTKSQFSNGKPGGKVSNKKRKNKNKLN